MAKGKNTDEYKSVFGNRRGGKNGIAGTANWEGQDADTLWRLVYTVTSRGGAVRFGYTRDGGAYALGFYYGNEKTTEYCRPGEDVAAWLADWIDFYANMESTGGKSPG